MNASEVISCTEVSRNLVGDVTTQTGERFWENVEEESAWWYTAVACRWLEKHLKAITVSILKNILREDVRHSRYYAKDAKRKLVLHWRGCWKILGMRKWVRGMQKTGVKFAQTVRTNQAAGVNERAIGTENRGKRRKKWTLFIFGKGVGDCVNNTLAINTLLTIQHHTWARRKGNKVTIVMVNRSNERLSNIQVSLGFWSQIPMTSLAHALRH